MIYDEWKTEKDVIGLIGFEVKNSRQSMLKLIVNDDNDDNYVPNFDFEYVLVDCAQDNKMENWSKYLEMDKPVVFTNTSCLFDKLIEDYKQFDPEHAKNCTGAGRWARNFYIYFREKMFHQNSKIIMLVKDEDVTEMWNAYNIGVNRGMTIYLSPYLYKKDVKVKKLNSPTENL